VAGKIEGKIVAYGESGNLVTDIANDRLQGAPHDQTVAISCDEQKRSASSRPITPRPCTLMAILGPSGCLS
jgi:hypothetical protein